MARSTATRDRGIGAMALLPWAAALATLAAACDPFNTEFDAIEEAIFYRARGASSTPSAESVDRVRVMTYNVKFGGGRIDFFYDCFGDRVLMTEAEVRDNIAALAAEIRRVSPDLLLLEEVDVQSKRSAYIDQVQLLLDSLPGLDYGAYASQWKADFIPSDGLGRMNSGIAILSRWPFVSGRRIALPKIAAQDALRQYFYLKRAILDTRVQIPGLGEVAALVTHAAAYATDDTKHRHVELFKEELDRIAGTGQLFVAGGDLNTLPPDASAITGFPDQVCEDEDFDVEHQPSELQWLVPFYEDYTPAISREQYRQDEAGHFTHSVSKDHFWNRKLDYLFTNGTAVEAGTTHQATMSLSDHCPVSGAFGAPQ